MVQHIVYNTYIHEHIMLTFYLLNKTASSEETRLFNKYLLFAIHPVKCVYITIRFTIYILLCIMYNIHIHYTIQYTYKCNVKYLN